MLEQWQRWRKPPQQPGCLAKWRRQLLAPPDIVLRRMGQSQSQASSPHDSASLF